MQTHSEFQGKTYIVTGASSGIGRASALALGRTGANVVLAARRTDLCETVAEDVRAAGGQAFVVKTDVCIEADVVNMVRTAMGRYGRIDGVVNNAGSLGQSATTHLATTDNLQHVLTTNVLSVFWSMKYAISAMLGNSADGSSNGAIVNIASIAGHVTSPGIGAYTASKHAVLGLTKTAALEYFSQGIRINAVCPGPTQTPMSLAGFGSVDNLNGYMQTTPAGRPGQPEETAAVVLMLLSSAASYVSGQAWNVDGGLMLT